MRRPASKSGLALLLAMAVVCSWLSGHAARAQDSFNSNTEPASWEGCARGITDAIQAFQIVDQASEACAGPRSGPALTGSVTEACWGPLDAALGEVQTAASIFQHAHGNPGAVAAGNAHNRQAGADLKTARECRNQEARDQFNAGSNPRRLAGGTAQGAPPGQSYYNPQESAAAEVPGRRYGVTPAETLADAKAAAQKINEGAGFPPVMEAVARLQQDQVNLPPDQPRPIDCLDLMMSAKNWSQTDPQQARAKAAQSLVCYDNNLGKKPLTGGTQQNDWLWPGPDNHYAGPNGGYPAAPPPRINSRKPQQAHTAPVPKAAPIQKVHVTKEGPDGSRTGSIQYGGEQITVTLKNSHQDGEYFHEQPLTKSINFTMVDGKLTRNPDRSQPDTFQIDALYTSTERLPTIPLKVLLLPPRS